MTPEQFHSAYTKAEQILNHYLPAIQDERTKVSVSPVVAEGLGKGKPCSLTSVKFVAPGDQNYQNLDIHSIFEDTDSAERVIKILVGSFLTEWWRITQQPQVSTSGATD